MYDFQSGRARAVLPAAALLIGLFCAGCGEKTTNATSDNNPPAAENHAPNPPGPATSHDADRAIDKTKEAGDNAGDKIHDSGENLKDALGNPVLTAKVKSALIGDKQVDAVGINVDTKPGDVVVLRGHVKTAAEKQRAEAIAKKTQGTKKVINQLTIGK